MKIRFDPAFGLALLAALGVTLGACAPASERREAFDTKTRATMEDIVTELRVLLPLAASDERFSAPEHREAVARSLTALADAGGRLDRHGSEGDAAFGVFSHALAEDTADARARWEEGRFDEVRFLVEELTDDCVGCHSRLAGPSSVELGPQLLADVDRGDLDEREWARLLVATRQFAPALDAYEQLLSAPAGPVTRLDLESVLVDYLVVSVRVTGELDRARVTVEGVAQRTDVPRYLAAELAGWSAALTALEVRGREGSGLEQARVLLEPGDGQAEPDAVLLSGRDRLIHDLVASAALYGFLANHPDASPTEQAEAYYWLGVTELRISRSLWLSPADAYLEASIRSAPESGWAADAYDLLELHTLFEYQGSAGLNVPQDVRLRLEALRALVEAHSAAP